jgi:hypothetical protein
VVKEARVILLHPLAPAKPAVGKACNGCGVCCAAEPCPVGMLLSRRVTGPCVALEWNAALSVYRCGAVTQRLPRLPRWLAAGWQKLSLRWISAGSGCDCSLQTSIT